MAIVCCRLTVADFFKLIAPVGWFIVALGACAAYIAGPAVNGRTPRWAPGALALFSGVAALGTAIEIWMHWRTSSYSLAGSVGGAQREKMRKQLRVRLVCALSLVIIDVVLLLFFALVAPDIDGCGHSSCGADVSWTAIVLVFLLMWLALTVVKQRAFKRQAAPPAEAEMQSVEGAAASDEV